MIPARFALILPLAFATAAIAQQAPTPEALTGIPGIEMIYYDVSGTSVNDIRKDMNEKRPTDANDGKRVDALSKWRIGWRIRRNSTGQCDLNGVKILFESNVTLPRLADEAKLSKSVRERWQHYYAALTQHEAGHIGYAYAHREDVATAIKGATCETANAVGMEAIRKIAEHDIAYDAETNHGIKQGAVFP